MGGSLSLWFWRLSAAVDLSVPCGILLLLQRQSPANAYSALSTPALLIIPLVILLSILRLRPSFSLRTGIVAGLIHIALTVRAMAVGAVDLNHDRIMFFGYGILLALTGAAAAAVSFLVRRYVIEAVEEATAAETAQRGVAMIQRDIRVASDIQKGLLPTDKPLIPGFDIAGMAHPAELAGGDYYDWQPLPDGRLAVAIADVTGHGIGPALVMAVCRAYARASAPIVAGPEQLLRRLNDLIVADVKGARFITMAIALVHADGVVELVSAGHGPTLLFHAATGDIQSFGGDGLPLGILDDQQYGPVRAIQMEAGDVLLMLTDGFFEQTRAGDREQFGLERLSETLKKQAHKSAGAIVLALELAVRDFSNGAAQADDMTAVAIKRL
jgi:serine phosphatase RsbU (regulator of sigma subunit)